MDKYLGFYKILHRIVLGLIFLFELLFIINSDIINDTIVLLNNLPSINILTEVLFIFIILSVSSLGILLLRIISSLIMKIIEVFTVKIKSIYFNKKKAKYIIRKFVIFSQSMQKCANEILSDDLLLDCMLKFVELKLDTTINIDRRKINRRFNEVKEFTKKDELSLFFESFAYNPNLTQVQGEMNRTTDSFYDCIYLFICAVIGLSLLYVHLNIHLILFISLLLIMTISTYIIASEIKLKTLLMYLFYYCENFVLSDGSQMSDRPSDY